MLIYLLLCALMVVNVWMTRRVWAAPEKHLRHKKFLIALIWAMPMLGAMTARSHLRHYVPGEAYRRTSRQRIARLSTEVAPEQVAVAGAPPSNLAGLMRREKGLPLLNRDAVQQWMSSMGDAATRELAAEALLHAWLLHLRDALGPRYGLHQAPNAWLLSTLEPGVVEDAAALLRSAQERVSRWLGTLAAVESWHAPVLLFDDAPTCASYLAAASVSEGLQVPEADRVVFVDGDCPHFAGTADDFRSGVPTIVRELAYQSLAHRPIPAWLSHGIAECAKRQLTDVRPHEWIGPTMLASFWDDTEIHAFWSGEAFVSNDERRQLACGLAYVLTERLSSSKGTLERLAASASREDAGSRAAREILGIDLGAFVCALLGNEPHVSWSPRGTTVV